MGSLWNRSGTIERYGDDLRAPGAKAYFFAGGTTTPMSVYEDSGEASAHTHPLTADTNGRWPDVFVPYVDSFDVRVTTANGVQLTFTAEIPNPAPIDTTVVVDAENTVVTGMVHAEFVNAIKAGYVRCNGRTIGNATSTGTERANADTEDLFVYLWNNVGLLSVSGGRGGTGAADYAANKTIALPDLRGTSLIGLDDMGNTAAGAFGSLTFGSGSQLLPGSAIGTNSLSLTIAQLPVHVPTASASSNGSHNHTGTSEGQNQNHTHSGTTDSGGAHIHTASSGSDGSHTHSVNVSNNTLGGVTPGPTSGSTSVTTSFNTSSDGSHTHSVTVDSGGTHTHTFTTGDVSQDHTHAFTTSTASSHSHTITVDSIGSGAAINNMPYMNLITWFIKL